MFFIELYAMITRQVYFFMGLRRVHEPVVHTEYLRDIILCGIFFC